MTGSSTFSPARCGAARRSRWPSSPRRSAPPGTAVSVAVDSTRAGTGTEEPAAPTAGVDGALETGCAPPLHPRRSAGRVAGHAAAGAARARRGARPLLPRPLGRPPRAARGAVVVRSVHAPRSLRRASLPRADAFTVPTRDLGAGVCAGRGAFFPPLVLPPSSPDRPCAALQASLGLSAPVVGMVSTFQCSRRHVLALTAFARGAPPRSPPPPWCWWGWRARQGSL